MKFEFLVCIRIGCQYVIPNIIKVRTSSYIHSVHTNKQRDLYPIHSCMKVGLFRVPHRLTLQALFPRQWNMSSISLQTKLERVNEQHQTLIMLHSISLSSNLDSVHGVLRSKKYTTFIYVLRRHHDKAYFRMFDLTPSEMLPKETVSATKQH